MGTNHPARRGRSIYGAIGAVGLLGALTVPGVPILGGLLDPAPPTSTHTPTAAEFQRMGTTSSANGRLTKGCHPHAWHYAVKPPTTDWALEVFLIGPRGGHVASDVLISGGDPKSGTKSFTICRNTTNPGTFTIRARITVQDDLATNKYVGSIRSTTFTMSR